MKTKNKKIMVIGLICIIIGIGFYSYKKYYLSSHDEYPQYVKTTTINEKFFKSMNEKDLIFYKIINSIDLYNSAEGEYIKTDYKLDIVENIRYYADIKNKSAYYIINNHGANKNEEILCVNNVKTEFNNTDKVCRIRELATQNIDENIRKLKPKDRYVKKEDNIYINRSDGDFLIDIKETLFNEELQSFLYNYDNWKINNEETYLNRDGICISGKLGFTGKNKENNFKILVDKKTGVILKYNLFTKTGDLIYSIITKKIKLDGDIDSKIFEKTTNGYSEK